METFCHLSGLQDSIQFMTMECVETRFPGIMNAYKLMLRLFYINGIAIIATWNLVAFSLSEYMFRWCCQCVCPAPLYQHNRLATYPCFRFLQVSRSWFRCHTARWGCLFRCLLHHHFLHHFILRHWCICRQWGDAMVVYDLRRTSRRFAVLPVKLLCQE